MSISPRNGLTRDFFDHMAMKWKVGDKIYSAEEKKPYAVRACDSRYLICTKPFNLRPRTVIYTIVGLKAGIRGTDGYSFSPYDYYSNEDCQNFLKELQDAAKAPLESEDGVIYDVGSAHISYRNRIKLNIIK